MENYINITTAQREKRIYRVMTVDRLLEIFETSKNVLVKPSLWDDPFENFLLNTPQLKADGNDYFSVLRDRAYGQCWSLNIESDAMWRIYAPNKNGVKIETTVTKLFNSLYRSTSPFPRMSCFIGKVDYRSKKSLTAMARDVRDGGKSAVGSYIQAKSLLIKRIAFKHEQEVRLIYLEPRNCADNKIHSYEYDPFVNISALTFDPRMSESLFSVYKNHFKSLGFQGRVIRSGLYTEMQLK